MSLALLWKNHLPRLLRRPPSPRRRRPTTVTLPRRPPDEVGTWVLHTKEPSECQNRTGSLLEGYGRGVPLVIRLLEDGCDSKTREMCRCGNQRLTDTGGRDVSRRRTNGSLTSGHVGPLRHAKRRQETRLGGRNHFPGGRVKQKGTHKRVPGPPDVS